MNHSQEPDPIAVFSNIHEKSASQSRIPSFFRSSVGFMGLVFVVAALVQIVVCVLCLVAFGPDSYVFAVMSLPGFCIAGLFVWIFGLEPEPERIQSALFLAAFVIGPCVTIALYSFIIAVIARYLFRHRLRATFQFTLLQLMVFVLLFVLMCSALASIRWWMF